MQEQEAVIEVYNEKGEVIVSKPRKDVNKKIDILKSVVILVVNGKKELFHDNLVIAYNINTFRRKTMRL